MVKQDIGTETPPAAVSRRHFLRMAGGGAGLVVVAGAGFTTWRAVDEGVFSAGQGPALRDDLGHDC